MHERKAIRRLRFRLVKNTHSWKVQVKFARSGGEGSDRRGDSPNNCYGRIMKSLASEAIPAPLNSLV